MGGRGRNNSLLIFAAVNSIKELSSGYVCACMYVLMCLQV